MIHGHDVPGRASRPGTFKVHPSGAGRMAPEMFIRCVAIVAAIFAVAAVFGG